MMFFIATLVPFRNASKEVIYIRFLIVIAFLLVIACPTSAQTLKRDFQFPLPLFAFNSAWNQTVTAAAVLPESNRQILTTYRVLRGDTTSLYPRGQLPPTTWPFADISYDEYSIPIFRMGFRDQNVMICDYDGNMGWPGPKFPKDQARGSPVIVPAPNSMVRPSGPQNTAADGHLVLYNPKTFMEYDFWQATTVRDAPCKSLGGGLTGTTIFEAGVIDFFDVRGSGANPNTYYSARATGTPLLAGLILPEDIENGIIAHALAFAIPAPRNTSKKPSMPLSSDYFYPTSTTETDFFNTDPYALAAGQRIRLKKKIVNDEGNWIDEDELAIITQKFLEALRTYGAILVDNASGFSFYAEDFHTAVLRLTDNQIKDLIGQSSGTLLPEGKTKWQIVLDKLNDELEKIPFAYGPWKDGQNPASARITISNFEVVESVKIKKSGIWHPKPLTTFDWQLQKNVNINTAAEVVDVDAFHATKEFVKRLHNKGKKVIAYISVGTIEDWRSDTAAFPPEIIGKEYRGWEGEKWLDIRQIEKLAPILRSRLDMIKQKGFDAIEPDNIDGFEYPDSGFPLTKQDAYRFCQWLVEETHKRGLSIGQKNAGVLANDLVSQFDWILIEDAFADGWYEEAEVYIRSGKTVFATEYTDTNINFKEVCTKAKKLGYTVILKERDLTAWIKTCEK